jgi:hypothetical protein
MSRKSSKSEQIFHRATITPAGIALDISIASALLMHCCEDPFRANLRGPFVEVAEGQVWICATDGRRATRFPVGGQGLECPDHSRWELEGLERAIKIAKIEGKVIVLTWASVEASDAPPLAQVVPDPAVVSGTAVCLDPALLADVAKSGQLIAKAMGGDVSLAIRTVSGRLDPVRLDIIAGEATVLGQFIVMPMLVGGSIENGREPDRKKGREFEGQIAEMGNTILDLRGELHSAKWDLGQATSALAEVRAECKEWEERARRLASEIVDAQDSEREARATIDRLLGELEAARAGSLALELDAVEGSLANALDAIARARTLRQPSPVLAVVR